LGKNYVVGSHSIVTLKKKNVTVYQPGASYTKHLMIKGLALCSKMKQRKLLAVDNVIHFVPVQDPLQHW